MLIFAPKIALRADPSDPARNHHFPTDFLSARLQCSQLLRNCAKIKAVYRRARGERRLEKHRRIAPNCGKTSSPGKIKYNCRYFIMTFRTHIHKKNSVKMVFILYRVLYSTGHLSGPFLQV
jgi:hypothetical protein